MKKLFCLMALVSAVLISCEPSDKPKDKEGVIAISVDNAVIKADGRYGAELKVTILDTKGETIDITSEADIYCEGDDLPLDNPVFTTTKPGEYSFYAVYGFEISENITVKAVDGVMDLPADTDPKGTSFRQRMILLQHTGTACPNCPKLMTPLKYLSEDESYNKKYHHVASHSYNVDDPAYSDDATLLSNTVLGVKYYPWLTANLTTEYTQDYSDLPSFVDKYYREEAVAGVSASVSFTDGDVNANVSLKAGEDGRYRIAVWLLEDGIYGAQSSADASWQNTHENCLRKMHGETRTECVYGKNLGDLQKGEAVDFIVSFDLESNWKGEHCKVMVIAVNADRELITSAVCPVGGSVGYEYM